jgi:uncharacterized protein (DUF58 family)
MLVSGVFGRKNLYGIGVSLEIPEEVFAATDTPVIVRLENKRKRMPAFLIKILIGDREVLFPFVGAGSRMAASCSMEFPRRGISHIEAVFISSPFPFNFFTRFRRIKLDMDLVVFPKAVKGLRTSFPDRQAKTKGDVLSSVIGHDADIISIRDYTFGDQLKYISWKSTAKTGHLKTKELSSIRLQEIMIDFDKMNKENLEYELSCLTYLIIVSIRSKIPVGLKIDGRLYKPGVSNTHKLTLLGKLALYAAN